MALKRGAWSNEDDLYLKANWQTMTDKQISEQLHRSVAAIAARRRTLNLSKPPGRPKVSTTREAILTTPTAHSLARLSKDERLEYYRSNFEKSARYKQISSQLLEDEIEFYREKYIETLDSVDSITILEEDLVHSMIMKEIDIGRKREEIMFEYKRNRELRELDETPTPVNSALHKELIDAEKQLVVYREKLNMTREQRLKTDREEKITLTSIVRGLMDKHQRQESGEMAGQLEWSRKQCEQEMQKMNFLLGDLDGE